MRLYRASWHKARLILISPVNVEPELEIKGLIRVIDMDKGEGNRVRGSIYVYFRFLWKYNLNWARQRPHWVVRRSCEKIWISTVSLLYCQIYVLYKKYTIHSFYFIVSYRKERYDKSDNFVHHDWKLRCIYSLGRFSILERILECSLCSRIKRGKFFLHINWPANPALSDVGDGIQSELYPAPFYPCIVAT